MIQGFPRLSTDTPYPGALEEITLTERVAEVKAKLAHTVRNNSRRHAALTSTQLLSVLSKDLPRDTRHAIMEELSRDAGLADIKTIMTHSGRTFFYSLAHLTPQQAVEKGRAEDLKDLIAERIRRDSRVTTTITPLSSLFARLPDLPPAQVCSVLNEMQPQLPYRDIKTISTFSGELYLYSDLHLTEKYAALLARAAVNDACTTIVDTVREESRVYPRPTKVSLFTSQVFGIPEGALQPCIVRVLNKPEYGDIRKLVHPETEAEYLYSNLHMNEEHAFSVMKWMEGGG